MYNYLKEMKEDIKNYINEEMSIEEIQEMNDPHEELNDMLLVCDSVTGNASGSYTFNRLQAKLYVLDNMDLLAEACECFCVDNETLGDKFISEDWEWMDVTIRCWVLSQAINKALDELL